MTFRAKVTVAAPGSACVWYTLRANLLAETRALTRENGVSIRFGSPQGGSHARRAAPASSWRG